MTYIHELPNWPDLHWDNDKLSELLGAIRHQQGFLLGRMAGLGFDIKAQANLEILTTDILTSSAIEGEKLDPTEVRSSLAKRLGVDIGGVAPVNRHVEGIVEMMLDATQHYAQALTQERLYAWHGALFPTGRSGLRAIKVAAWRDEVAGPMQVVSGPVGRECVHFEAPDADRLHAEMSHFLAWFNESNNIDPVLKSGVAHFWFVTVHPFEDGNGRIARAIADMCLAKADGISERFYSMSSAIEKERKAYYNKLECSQKGELDITAWLEWFLSCLSLSIETADVTLEKILHKAKLWEGMRNHSLNDRQRKVISLLLESFQGKLTSAKYAKLTKCSHDTALRDIHALIGCGLMRKGGGGRSTHYELVQKS